MKKNLIFKSVSVMSAFAIVFSLTSVTAYADEPTHTVIDGNSQTVKPEIIEGNIRVADENCALEVFNEGEVEVTGYVELKFTDDNDSSSGTAVMADSGSSVKIDKGVGSVIDGISANHGSEVLVNGHLEADKIGISAANGSEVQLNGDITQSGTGVQASGDETVVSIEGNINASDTGIEAYSDSVVHVAKDIKDPDTGVMIENATVIVEGNICADEAGAIIKNGGELIVKGDISGDEAGVVLDMTDPARSDYAVTVEGTISSEDGYALIIVPPASGTATSALELVLYKLEASEGKAIGVLYPEEDADGGDDADDDDDDLLTTSLDPVEVIANAINYIIKFKNKDNAGTITGYDTTYEFIGYKTMKKSGSVEVSVKPGYYLKGSSDVTITRNDNGTYTVKLKEGSFGGIDLRILKEAIEDETGSDVIIENEDANASDNSGSAASGIVVTNGNDGNVVPVVGGTVPAKTVSLNLSEITPSQMKEAIVNNIASTPEGGVLRIETDSVSCFDEAMLEAFEANGNIDIELIFMHKGQRMRIFIPRGTNIRSLLDEKGYCGYLRLAEILGAQTI